MAHFIYARKSQEDKNRQVQSISSQVSLARDLAVKQNANIVDVIEEAQSAWEPGRPKFNDMIERLRAGEANGIIAWHPNRLSRNEVDAGALVYLVRKQRIDLKFVNYTFDNTPEGIMMLQLALSQSQYESSKLSVEVRRGLNQKRKSGWFPHRAPEGYLNDYENHTIIPDPVRFPLIRQAWDNMLTGRYSSQAVIDRLNAQGYLTKQRRETGGGPLSRTVGYKIFINPFYKGICVESGIPYRGSHVPMVTEEEFDRVQEILGIRSKPWVVRRELPYANVMKCELCGSGITGEVKNGAHRSGVYCYYRCGGRRCSRKAITESRFEVQVCELLAKLTLAPVYIDLLRAEHNRGVDVHLDSSEATETAQRMALAASESKLANLLDLRLSGAITTEEYLGKREELDTLAMQQRRTLAERNNARSGYREQVLNAIEFSAMALDVFRHGEPAQKRTIVTGLSAQYRFNEGAVSIEVSPLATTLMAIKERIEPVDIGSGSTEKGPLGTPISDGWARASFLELCRTAQLGGTLPSLSL